MRPLSGQERHGTTWATLALVVVALGPCSLTSCFEDGVTRPDDYNTHKYRRIEIQYNQALPAPYGVVRPLNGVHGAPLPVVPGDGDLKSLYWWQPASCENASCPPDGAHLSMVRIGTDTLCDLSMESVFPNPKSSTSDIAEPNYDVRALDDHMEAIRAVGSTEQTAILWQFGLNPGAGGFCQVTDDDRALQLGEPVPVCGDNVCNGDEDTISCVADCGSECEDGACNGEETSTSCPEDCLKCAVNGDCSECGDGECDEIEKLNSACVADCQADFGAGDGACSGTENATNAPLDCISNGFWKEAGVRILRHLSGDKDGDPKAVDYGVKFVEFMDDPAERLGYTEGANFAPLHDTYQDFARLVKTQTDLGWEDKVNPDDPDDIQPVIHVGGISYTIRSVEELEFDSEAQKHPILLFIDSVAAENSATCAQDCGNVCGDGVCNGSEHKDNCSQDCGVTCGDDVCGADEDTTTCHLDCGNTCGDGTCNGDEKGVSPKSPTYCLADCGPRCGNGYCGVPLDFLSFRTRTAHPHDAACIAGRLRGYLDQKGLSRTKLLLAGVEPDLTDSQFDELEGKGLDDDLFVSAHLGAFQAAARIFLQSPLDPQVCAYADVAGPADWMIAGRVPRVAKDLADHAGEDPVALEEQDMFIDSPFVYRNGAAKPAFMSLFPFRQVAGGHEMVTVTEGSDTQGMAVLASHPSNSGRVLHVIIANSNIQEGNADITYDLRLNQFVSTAKTVEYKLATLDRAAITCSIGKTCEVHLGNPPLCDAESPFTPGICQSESCAPNCCDTSEKCGYASFQFSEVGVLETENNTVRFVQPMAVPSVHYIQFLKPN